MMLMIAIAVPICVASTTSGRVCKAVSTPNKNISLMQRVAADREAGFNYPTVNAGPRAKGAKGAKVPRSIYGTITAATRTSHILSYILSSQKHPLCEYKMTTLKSCECRQAMEWPTVTYGVPSARWGSDLVCSPPSRYAHKQSIADKPGELTAARAADVAGSSSLLSAMAGCTTNTREAAGLTSITIHFSPCGTRLQRAEHVNKRWAHIDGAPLAERHASNADVSVPVNRSVCLDGNCSLFAGQRVSQQYLANFRFRTHPCVCSPPNSEFAGAVS
jgi:hypothetical protein